MTLPETLAGLLAGWFLLDCLTTFFIIRKRGGKELNPVMRWAIGELGLEEALAIIKFLVLVVVWFLTVGGWFEGSDVKWLYYLHVMYAFIVSWNVYQILKTR